ncbi:MAG: MBL fold metallo-hydrolase [Gammaproteobacteria bacterium]|nr:MBL fold metallo-hydrolase [Gammaproteobacteria bacterium]
MTSSRRSAASISLGSLVVAAATSIALISLEVRAQGLDAPQIRTEQLGDGLWVLFGPGAGNMIVSIGDSGVLMVDNGVPNIVEAYQRTIAGLGGERIDFVINTHWHFDHADGNKVLGPQGTWLIAHENSRTMMMQDNRIDVMRQVIDQPAYPPEAWPILTYEDTMTMHFNGERIDLIHASPAHTEGDTAVIFRDRNLAHMGDVYISSGYPFIDVDHGGDLDGFIQFCERVLEELDPGAVVVPGHGAVSSYQGLSDYATMLRTVRARVAALVDSGATLEQVIAARPTSDWDEALGNPTNFVTWAYRSLTEN